MRFLSSTSHSTSTNLGTTTYVVRQSKVSEGVSAQTMRGSSSRTVDRLGLGEPRSRSRSFDHFAPTSGYSNTRGSPTHQTRQGSASKRPRSPRRRAEEMDISSSVEEQQVSSDGSTIFALSEYYHEYSPGWARKCPMQIFYMYIPDYGSVHL